MSKSLSEKIIPSLQKSNDIEQLKNLCHELGELIIKKLDEKIKEAESQIQSLNEHKQGLNGK